MDLKARHLPLILLGGIVGASVGWLVSFLFKEGAFPPLDGSVGLHEAGRLLGAIGGVAIAVLITIARAARDLHAKPASYIIGLHGWGSMLLGHSDMRPDGSYVATEWFTIVWIPIFPVCRYRVIKNEEAVNPLDPIHREYTILEKMPLSVVTAGIGYTIMTCLWLLAVGFAFVIFR